MTNRNFTNFNEFLNIRYFRRVDSIYMDLSDFDYMIEKFKKISEENNKLKVENERFSGVINALAKAVDKQDEEIKQLKASGKYMLDIQKNMLTESNEIILENGKLKEEVKRLKGKSEMYQEMADCFCENNTKLKKDVENATNCFKDTYEENNKLKAEIERLKESRNYISEVNGSLVRINDKQDREITKLKDENKQLKSELEQSVKLPCKVGDIVYAYSTYFGILAYEINSIHICCGTNFEAIASRNDDMLDNFDFDIEDIGKTIFLTREEAEQSLKGQV